jgi:putative transposase
VGRNAQPSAAIIDAQSVKTVEETAETCGFDAHKCVKGRKRHILVDTPGLLLAVYVTLADVHDQRGARCLLAGLVPVLPRLKKLWADAAYRGQELAARCHAEGGWDLEVVERPAGSRGFSLLPRHWVVERTLSWISHKEKQGWIQALEVVERRRPYRLTGEGKAVLQQQLVTMSKVVATGEQRLASA